MSRRKQITLGDDAGAAVVGALMVMLLMAGITAGFTALVITDTKVRSLDSTRTQSFYAVHAGLEKMTADLGDLFAANVAPTGAQVNALMSSPPSLGVTWEQPDGTNGYRIVFDDVDANGVPDTDVMTVDGGPFQGLVGLATDYRMVVTGRVSDRSESSLTRRLQTVAIPVFQFGIFSENDLSFFPGPNFSFGGRVHSNSNIFLATEATTPGLTLSDRVTSVGEIIRQTLSNGEGTAANGYNGNVRVRTATNSYRNLLVSEGSVTGGVGSGRNEPTWTNLSTGDYNYNIMSGNTGARRLDLPITQFGATPIDLIRRPIPNENITAPNVLSERFYSLASLRILLSDTAEEISGLPGVTATLPEPLGIAEPYVVSSNPPRPPFAQAPVAGTLGVRVPENTPLLGGFLKIEMCNQTLLPAGSTLPTNACWQDVTQQILNLGIASRAIRTSATGAALCADRTPNAIIRLQRALDNAGNCFTLAESTTNAQAPFRYVSNVLYDPREGALRDANPGPMQFGGLMYYIELDARNLARWFRGQIPAANCPIACTGINALNANGYTVYFSDRRGNKNAAAPAVETGEYGFEDIVNPTVAGGTPPNGVINTGEDFNGNNTLETYGQTPRPVVDSTAPLVAAARPWTSLDPGNAIPTAEEIAIARRNPPIFFRRALKLSNGSDLFAVAPNLQGLTVASENPVYIQGNWNSTGDFNGNHVATAVLADSVTLLSNNWNDWNSLTNPHDHDGDSMRNATTTWYRVAIIAGKGISFTRPANTPKDFGTDGGAHNFLRYIENWSGETLNYRGSIASLYFSRQAVGTYKCCDIVYSPPTRGYNFDVEFLTPALLPPRTPMFRDVNITGFSQIIRP